MDESFGALLRGHRRAAGLTQEALAERAALSGQAVGALERGDRRFPHRDTVNRLAVALELTDEQRAEFVVAASRRAVPRPPTSRDAAPMSGSVPPRQLPAAVAHFVGRDSHIKAMNELMGRSSTVVVSAISGMAGIGKTAFAVHWAHQVREQFPDGQLYVNLRGFDPGRSPMSSATAARVFLEALDVPPQRIPATPEAQIGLYRSLLAERRMLIVLDNAYDAEQIRPLLPGAPDCLALVTSRNLLAALAASDGAHLITLDLLTAAEAHELMVARLGADRVSAEPHAVEEIVTRCARLPLALAIVAARAAAHPQFPLAALAEELRDAQGSLDAFQSEDAATNVRTVLSWSYRTLSLEAARLLRLLGIHPGPDIAAPAAASLIGIPVRRLRPLLAELTRANLIGEHIPGRYAVHDLVRAYATEQAQAREPDDERHAAARRMLDHYLHTGRAAATLLNPQRTEVVLAVPRCGTSPEHLADYGQALAWLTAEREVLLAAVKWTTRTGLDCHTGQLTWILAGYLERRGYWQEWADSQHTALSAARRLGDNTLQADAHRSLGRAYGRLARADEAYLHYRQALDLYVELGDTARQARTETNLALLLEQQGRHPEALDHALRALDLQQHHCDGVGYANALNTVGWCHALIGEYELTLNYCRQAITKHQEIRDRDGEAATWDTLGYAHHHLGDHRQAAACFGRAIVLFRELGDHYYAALSLIHLGETRDMQGDRAAALDSWRQAKEILDELGHPAADQVRAKLSGSDLTPMPALTR